MKIEAKVGLFVFLGLLAFFLLSTQVNSFGGMGKKGYTITATMGTVLGLDKNAKVKMNGIDIGYVQDMTLAGRDVKVSMFIFQEAQIPIDSTIVMAQDSMLGSRFINLIPGVEDKPIASGGNLNKEKHLSSLDETSTSINDAAVELKGFIKELRETFNPQARADLQAAIANFKTMSANLSTAGEKFGVMSDSFNKTATTVNTKLPSIMDNLSGILSENRKPLHGALTSIDEFFQAGKPAVGKVENFFADGTQTVKKVNKYLDRMTNSELQMGLASHYMAKDRYAMTKLDVNYLPNPTRYYMIGLTSRDDYSRMDASGQALIPQKHDSGKSYLSAQIGKRYDNTLVRGGIIESTGGVGIEQYALHDKLKGSLEVFDFGAKNDVRTTKPHARAEVRYQMLKHLNLYGGVDGFLDSKTTNAYVGAGVSFIDDDLKYLLGSSSGALLK